MGAIKIAGVERPASIAEVTSPVSVKGVIWGVSFPSYTIAIWSGTLADIPDNWDLCNGDGDTPNLVAKFLRGAPAATEPGSTGGDDTHQLGTLTSDGSHHHHLDDRGHAHSVGSAGSHNHAGSSDTFGSDGESGMAPGSTGNHSHGGATDQDTNDDHNLNSAGSHNDHSRGSTADGRPPYYEVAYIMSNGAGDIETGIILIWSGIIASIPADWDLCDGGGARPDLREKFLRGINSDVTEPGDTGGFLTHLHTLGAGGVHTHTCDNASGHLHNMSTTDWTHNHNTGTEASYNEYDYPERQTDGGADHNHSVLDPRGIHDHDPMGNGGSHTHTIEAKSSLPAYRDVLYIYSTSATNIPTDSVMMWHGLIENIPDGWELCDGQDGRPDYREKFVRGAADTVEPGGTGGSDTHQHTDVNGGAHSDHSQTSAGSHDHGGDTDTNGAHTHSSASQETEVGAIVSILMSQVSAGDHSHSIGTADNHSDHSVVGQSPANHNHEPYGNDNTRPAYYEILFIIKE